MLLIGGAIGLVFLISVGGLVWYFTGSDDNERQVTRDFEVESTVYGFEDAATVDMLVKNRAGSPLRFRGCTLHVPEDVTVYTDHALFEEETRLVAVVSKAPAINYEYILDCQYIKEGFDESAEVVVEGQIVIPEPIVLRVDKEKDRIDGELRGSTLTPRVYAAIGTSDLRELLVREGDEDTYEFSLSGDTSQKTTVVAFGGINEAGFYND